MSVYPVDVKYMAKKAHYWSTLNQNEIERTAIEYWNQFKPEIKAAILEGAGYDVKWATLQWVDLTPELRNMFIFVTINVYGIEHE